MSGNRPHIRLHWCWSRERNGRGQKITCKGKKRIKQLRGMNSQCTGEGSEVKDSKEWKGLNTRDGEGLNTRDGEG